MSEETIDEHTPSEDVIEPKENTTPTPEEKPLSTDKNIEENDPFLSADEVEEKEYTAPPIVSIPPKAKKTEKQPEEKKGETPKPKTEEPQDEFTDYSDDGVESMFPDEGKGNTIGSVFGGTVSTAGLMINAYNEFASPILGDLAVPVRKELRQIQHSNPDIYSHFEKGNQLAKKAIRFSEEEKQHLEAVWNPVLEETGIGEISPLQQALMVTGGIAVNKGLELYRLRSEMDSQFNELMKAFKGQQQVNPIKEDVPKKETPKAPEPTGAPPKQEKEPKDEIETQPEETDEENSTNDE